MQLKTLELLAPAKNLECGKAAIDCGADAVYIGAQRFGARASAGNSVDDIRSLCEYAHPFGAKVYVTVNTLVYDDELDATRLLLEQLADAGVDAVLVQDMGILRLAAEFLSSPASHLSTLTSHLSLHASTQTDNRTPAKVRWLRDLGFSRVVLARELSVDEIAAIHQAVPDVELEVFVHGALCVSYSGLCYVSQHCFARSANRGACAQFCRMPFDLVDADGRLLEHQRHLLSLKDLNLSDHLDELIQAGATSFKIEGRLKDAGYVKNVVAAYSERLNQFISRHADRYCRASLGRCTYAFEPSLAKTFNRGFTTYFLHGRQPDIFSPDTPKALGEMVGRVKELRRDSFTVAGTSRFSNGDGLCFVNARRELEGFRVNRAEAGRLYPHQMPRGLRPGMPLYRNSDQQFERDLARPATRRRIPIVLRIDATGDGYSLSAWLSASSAALQSPAAVTVTVASEHQPAAKAQTDNIRHQLSRLGATIYECSGVEVPADFTWFVPNSVLAELRRRLVEALQAFHVSGGESRVDGLQPLVSSLKADVTALKPYDFFNIANRLAVEFYGVSRPTAFELHPDDRPLMQCRHCLRYAYGFCVKHGGRSPEWREPLSLRLSDGRRFRIEFDCRHCQMNVYGG